MSDLPVPRPSAEKRRTGSRKTKSKPKPLTLERLWNATKSALKTLDVRLQPARKTVEQSAILHFVAIAAAIFTVYQIWVDLDDRRFARQEQRVAEIERNWDRLLQRAGGSVRKGEAYNFLQDQGEDVASVDLSCENVGNWDDRTQTCKRAPTFVGINLRPKPSRNDRKFNISDFLKAAAGAVFQHARLVQARIDSYHLVESEVAGMTIENSVIVNTRIDASLKIRDSQLIDVYIKTSSSPIIQGSMLSRAIIDSSATVDVRLALLSISRNWAWADDRPYLMKVGENQYSEQISPTAHFKTNFTLCDPVHRDGYDPATNKNRKTYETYKRFIRDSSPPIERQLKIYDLLGSNIFGVLSSGATCEKVSWVDAENIWPAPEKPPMTSFEALTGDYDAIFGK